MTIINVSINAIKNALTALRKPRFWDCVWKSQQTVLHEIEFHTAGSTNTKAFAADDLSSQNMRDVRRDVHREQRYLHNKSRDCIHQHSKAAGLHHGISPLHCYIAYSNSSTTDIKSNMNEAPCRKAKSFSSHMGPLSSIDLHFRSPQPDIRLCWDHGCGANASLGVSVCFPAKAGPHLPNQKGWKPEPT